MTIALSLLFTAFLGLIGLIAAFMPNHPRHSSFERNRRRNEEVIRIDDLRSRRLADVRSLQRLLLITLLILLVPIAGALFGSVVGVLTVIIIVLLHGMFARIVPLHRFAQKLYDEQEMKLLGFIDQHKKFFTPFRLTGTSVNSQLSFESKEELEHLLVSDRKILTPTEKQLLIGAIQFEAKTVSDLMINQDRLFTVKKSDILGPLVLDDLYKSGHDMFPVVTGESKEIIGILRLRDVQTLDTSRRHTARVESAMDPDVRFIQKSQPISAALEVLISSQHHILVVKDQEGVVGIVTLVDILAELLGRTG